MALTLDATLSIKFNFVDESNSHGSVMVHLAASTTAAAAKTLADTLAAALQAASGCGVTGYTISYQVEDPVGSTPAVGSRVEHKGRYLFQRANGLSSRIEVPGILQSLVLSDGALDTAAGAVTDVSDAIITGGYTGPDGSDITAYYGAYEAFKGSTKRQLPTRRIVV